MTVGYSIRLLLFSSLGAMKFFSFFSKSEESWSVLAPMIFLGIGGVFGGFFFYFFVFEGLCFFFFASVVNKVFIIVVIGFGLFLGVLFFFFDYGFFVSKALKWFSFFGGSMWFLQVLSSQGLLLYPFFFFFFYLYKVDRGYMEVFGGQGIVYSLSLGSSLFGFFSVKSVLVSGIFFLFFFLFFFFLF